MVTRPRVLLADDHAMVAEGLRRVLEPEVEIVAIVEDGRALLRAARELEPDIIVADISMPLLNGLDAVRQLKEENASVRVIFLTMHADVDFAEAAFRAGASGYVLKQSAAQELLAAIRAVGSGKRYLTSLISEEALDAQLVRSGAGQNETPLTARQREVLQLIAEGKSLKEAAAILHLSARTVEFHRYKLMKLLDLHTTAELTRYAVRHGLIPED